MTSYQTIREKFKKYDLIEINSEKYLITSIKKDNLELLPIYHLLREDVDSESIILLRLAMDYAMIKKFKKLKKNDLLFLVNQTNPFILAALEKYFHERK